MTTPASDSPLVRAHAAFMSKLTTAAGAAEPSAKNEPAGDVECDLLPRLWQDFAAAADQLTGYDLALRISAATAGEARPLSVGTPAGIRSRLEALDREAESTRCPRALGVIAHQRASLARGEAPTPSYGLTEAAREARIRSLQERADSTKDPFVKAQLARAMSAARW